MFDFLKSEIPSFFSKTPAFFNVIFENFTSDSESSRNSTKEPINSILPYDNSKKKSEASLEFLKKNAEKK